MMVNLLEDEYQVFYFEYVGFDCFMLSFIEKINIV